MLDRLRKSFDSGVEKVRLLAAIISERVKVEVAVTKLLWKTSDLEKKRDEIARAVGERVFDLRSRPELNLLADQKIKGSIAEMEKVVAEMNEIKSRASQIGKAAD
ncbi:MAG: hypothetical protein Kow0025_21160 [Thermodesulfovibrionales bacterium]